METERFDTVVIGGSQAGLTAGYYLRKEGRSFVILDSNDRVGDAWRQRYDSLRLFTAARYAGLPGSRFPGRGSHTPTKDELADYLETYAERFSLPVRSGTRVDRVSRNGDTYIVAAGDLRLDAANVIVATGANQTPRTPAIARDLDPGIVQMHSVAYRNPSQLRDGGVLVVGAGNSGGDLALESVSSHPTWLSGPETGHIPFDIDGTFGRVLGTRLVVFVGRHVLTQRTPIGRKMRAGAGIGGTPLVRVKPAQLVDAGVVRVPRVVATRDGKPVLEDGRVLEVANVIWCTGFRHDLSWIDLPIFDHEGAPMHERGVVTTEPGLYFVGLPWQFAIASDVLPGVGRDAAYVVKGLVRRSGGLTAPHAAVSA
jgi:putative flavoprotein involved in K+ transport